MDFLLDIAKRRESEAVKESKKIDSFYIEESLSFKSSLFAASRRKKKRSGKSKSHEKYDFRFITSYIYSKEHLSGFHFVLFPILASFIIEFSPLLCTNTKEQ
jgi:hypothetical protein